MGALGIVKFVVYKSFLRSKAYALHQHKILFKHAHTDTHRRWIGRRKTCPGDEEVLQQYDKRWLLSYLSLWWPLLYLKSVAFLCYFWYVWSNEFIICLQLGFSLCFLFNHMKPSREMMMFILVRVSDPTVTEMFNQSLIPRMNWWLFACFLFWFCTI